MSSASSAATTAHQSLWNLQSLMLQAKFVYPQDKTSSSVFYAYQQKEEAMRLYQLLVDCGVVSTQPDLKHTISVETGLTDSHCFGVLLTQEHITRINSKIHKILYYLREQEMLEYQQSVEHLGNTLLLRQLMNEASKIQMYVGTKPSGKFYACNSKETAIALAKLLITCDVLKAEKEHVAQHCRHLGEKRFGVVLQDSHLDHVVKFTDKILISEAGKSDFVALLAQMAKKTRTDAGCIQYQFKDQRMALIASRSLWMQLKIGKDDYHPKDLVQGLDHFAIIVTELEDKKIQKRANPSA